MSDGTIGLASFAPAGTKAKELPKAPPKEACSFRDDYGAYGRAATTLRTPDGAPNVV